MLEFIVIFILCTRMGETMRARGYPNPIGFQVAVPVVWLGLEAVGYVTFQIVRAMLGHDAPVGGVDFEAYLAALLCGSLGLITLFVIARSMPLRIKPGELHRRPPPPVVTGPRPPMPQGERPAAPQGPRVPMPRGRRPGVHPPDSPKPPPSAPAE